MRDLFWFNDTYSRVQIVIYSSAVVKIGVELCLDRSHGGLNHGLSTCLDLIR